MENKKSRILVVDDDPAMLKLIERKLERGDFVIITSMDSKKALELLDQNYFNLIICDIMMPQMNGYEFRQHVLEKSSTKDIPFIFLTAKSQPIDQIRGFKLRADDYITKPFDPDVLLARVQSVIERFAVYAEKTQNDQLTGLLNHRALAEKIRIELKRIFRYKEKGSLIFIDIDNFKQVNDHYGHPAGDRVLIQLGQVFKHELRTTDYAGRYGGEEFLLYIVNADKELAFKITKRLLSIFRETAIGDEKIHCTFSAGVVSAPEDGRNYTTLCKKADEAMYMSKKNGRNQITLYRS